jgi:hypothetical protein
VIEPSFNDLLEKFSKPSLRKTDESSGYDPEALRSSHTEYLTNLVDGLFMSTNTTSLSRLLRQLLQHVDSIVDIIQQHDDIDVIRTRGVKAIVDECVRVLEAIAETEGKGRVEKLLLALDGGQWFTGNIYQARS